MLNMLLLLVLFIKIGYLKWAFSAKLINVVIWGFVVVFALNTVGNLFAETKMEMIAGGLLTLISSILCWRIVN